MMRARLPDLRGTVDRNGVRIAYEVYESEPRRPTILLTPSWSIVHSRMWKAQLPYLARHWRVVTFDPRGNGGSDRPDGGAHYTDEAFVADAVAILDATGTDRALAVGLSRGGRLAVRLAARHPSRVAGLALVAPSIPLGPHPRFRPEQFLADVAAPEGWQKWNARYWQRNWPDFVDFFMREVFVEPHSTKQIEDGVAWGLETSGHTIAQTMQRSATPDEWRALLRRIRCPVRVLQGTLDRVTLPEWSARIAELTGGELVELNGSGHAPNAREPVVVNRLIHEFAGQVFGPARTVRRFSRPASRRRRVLFLSSPIGLGHARRDLAIAQQLRQRVDGLQVDWLTQDPVTRLLARDGERIHPASRWLASESAHVESESGEHDLHCFQAFREMDEILVANFMVFQEVVEEGGYALVVADEAWDVDHFWHEDPQLKRAPLAWLADFVGFLPMPEGGQREADLAADYNAEMIEHVARHGWVRDRAIFVGEPDDVVPAGFGPGLPGIRQWTEQHFDFSGYITGYDPAITSDTEAIRAELGYRPDERVCLVTVGGSGVGSHLLDRVVKAYPEMQSRIPGLRMVVVAGPRIEPASLTDHDGVEVHAYVPELYRHLAVCDLAIVQGGLTTTMELAATRRPFLYFPLRNHFEQQFHVRHRLDRYRAGRCLDYGDTTPESLAEAAVAELRRPVSYRPVRGDGAARAADLLANLLG